MLKVSDHLQESAAIQHERVYIDPRNCTTAEYCVVEVVEVGVEYWVTHIVRRMRESNRPSCARETASVPRKQAA